LQRSWLVLGVTAALSLAVVGGELGTAPPDGARAATGSATGGPPIGDGRGGFHLKRVGGFDKPMYVHGPRGARRIVFVVEREGRIRVVRGGRKRGTLLNIASKVSCCVSERGLFSVAFPRFRGSRRFYVFFTDNRGDLRIMEFRRRRGSLTRTKAGSGRTVLRIRHRAAANHNGGQLQFGPDGLLYIATGDGGTGGGTAQSKGSLLGKVLRINPKRGRGRPFRTPRSNPYVGESGLDQIFARGLRNPWRFSFDGRRIAIGDVGESSSEEVDYERLRRARGANFGWNVFEGTRRRRGGSLPGHDRPIHQYGHGGGRCSITGGYVSRDRRVRSLFRRYVYGDFCTGELRSLVPRARGARGDRALGVRRLPGLTSFGEDARGRIYAARHSGGVYRIAPNR
jgi:Glucose / Sorbosone dehydrogenase